MKLLKLRNGVIEICDKNGYPIHSFSAPDAVFADFNSDQTSIVITLANNIISVCSEKGSSVCNFLCYDAVQARWMGKEIAVQLKNGGTRVFSAKGSPLRSF